VNPESAFLAKYLGRTADCPPPESYAKRIRACLLADGIKQPPDKGAQSSPYNFAGPWPWAYALYHKLVTPAEAELHFSKFVNAEALVGLGTYGPYPDKSNYVYKVTHFNVHQHWCIGATADKPETRRMAREQALNLRVLLASDGLVTKADWTGSGRAIGWCQQGMIWDFMATGDALPLTIIGKLGARLLPAGEKNGVPYYWRNPNGLTDPNHQLECWQFADGTILRGLAESHRLFPSDLSKALLLHGLRIFLHILKPDGSWHSDYGWDAAGKPAFFSNPKDALNPWSWVAVLEALDALGKDAPEWAEPLKSAVRKRWAVKNAMRAGDSGFRDQAFMSIAIGCAPYLGWRDA